MSGLFGGRKDKTTGPWKPQGEALQPGYDQAREQFLGPGNQYDEWYRKQMAERGMGGSDLERAGNQQLQDTLGGDYLYGGKGFDAALDAASNKIIPKVQSGYEGMGRHGSGLEKTAQTGAIADAFAGLYNQERGRQMGAANQVPQYSGMDYNNIGAVGQAGDQQRQWIERYLRSIGGAGSGSTQEGGGSLGGWGGGLTGGLTGAAAGAPLGPWGMAAGGALGGLSGFFG